MSALLTALKKYLLIMAGTVSVAFAIIGIILPVLPTTPFLLLAAFCYLRGSRTFYDALMNNRFLGSYIRNYLEGRGMTLRMKIWTLSFLWIAILFSAIVITDSLVARIIFGVVLIGVTAHILLVKTRKTENVEYSERH